jgi:hypothetical protein
MAEHPAKEPLRPRGVATPDGPTVSTAAEAVEAATEIGAVIERGLGSQRDKKRRLAAAGVLVAEPFEDAILLDKDAIGNGATR